MKDETTVALRKWVENWKETGVILRRIRREELRRLDPTAVREWMAAFEDAFEKPSVVFHPDPLRASSSSRTGSKDFGGDQAVGGGRFHTAFCQEQGWRFCIIGGLALQRWGEPRLTRDVDIEVFTGFAGKPK